MKRITISGLALIVILAFSVLSIGAGWSHHHNSPLKVGEGKEYATITEALAAAASGDTIMVYKGTYNETINVEGFAGLTIKGVGKNDVVIQPSATLPWNVGNPAYDTRLAAIRVINSTSINFENLTIDFDLVKTAGRMHGILYWNSTGSLTGNVLKNLSFPDASGGYYEVCVYLRAPGYSDAARADVKVSKNTFIDVGRVAVLTHDFVNATITGNTFYKTNADFGYAIEMGSVSTGTISYNTIYGYNTPALSDGSNSAGIYVENCFTGPAFGSPYPATTKKVNLTGNVIYDCQWGIYVGNEWDTYAGDVDIVVTLNNNNVHDNTDGGIYFADEDKQYGSSVTVSGGGNYLTENGGYGYYIATYGDGDIKVSLKWEKISGQDTGVYVVDYGSPSSSSYSVSITSSDINGNTSYGINNTVAGFTVEATKNWWGDASGPQHPTLNLGGTGDVVSDFVNFASWLKRETKPWHSAHGNHNHWHNNNNYWHNWHHNPFH
ncbi:MAG: hypothetical protein A2Z15_06045 [Chloroflexi bacterium RBG_16_50_11]|nr:MAG: hypothetical protein A2Z15_06045 [Chloroflexi bacterium RBG_16_50_11]